MAWLFGILVLVFVLFGVLLSAAVRDTELTMCAKEKNVYRCEFIAVPKEIK